MNRRIFFILLLIGQFIYAQEVPSVKLYMSSNGKDSNPGTALLPLAGVKKGKKVLQNIFEQAFP